jgi:hypothetical protein
VSVEDNQRSGRPSTSKTTEMVEKFWELIHKHRHRTMHELTDTVGISYEVCQILTENLNMHRIAVKFVPWLLTNDQKQWRINICLELWEKANEDPTLTRISRIIMGDESWIWYRKKATIVTVKEPTITKSKKGTAGPGFNKEHAHRFFSTWRGLFMWICSS